VAEFMHVSIVFLVRVQCRRKESSRCYLISWWVSCIVLVHFAFFVKEDNNSVSLLPKGNVW